MQALREREAPKPDWQQYTIEKLPIFISLKEWSTSGHTRLETFLAYQFDVCNFPDAEAFIHALLQSGKALVLFDGLDEVNQERDQRRNLVTLLNDFARKYHCSQCLITCRIAANEYMFADFRDVEMADFTRDQIHRYAEKWFGEETQEDIDKRKQFIAELYEDQNEGLRELCSLPLLLSMLCLAYEDTLEFPQRRADLYWNALDALLRRWDTSRNIRRDEIYKGLSLQHKLDLFSAVAIQTFDNGEYFIRQSDLEEMLRTYLLTLPDAQPRAGIPARDVLKAIEAQHGIFVERAQSIYSFSHLSFQEYFAARYIATHERQGACTRLMQQRLLDNRWREVFLLTVSQLSESDAFFADMQQQMDAQIKVYPTVVRMLAWCNQKAVVAAVDQTAKEQLEFRVAYISLAHAHAHHYNYSLAIDFALFYAHSVAEIYRSIKDFDQVVKFIPAYADYWTELLEMGDTLAQEAPNTKSFVIQLKQLTPPNDQQAQAAWDGFADALHDIMLRERDMGHEWTLSEDEYHALNDYFRASELMVQCLNLARVHDRDAVYARMLQPPAVDEAKKDDTEKALAVAARSDDKSWREWVQEVTRRIGWRTNA